MKRINYASYLKKIKNSKFVVKHDNFDLKNFQRMLSVNPDLSQEYLDMPDYPQLQNLQQDIFSALYKYGPQMLNMYEIDYDYWLNANVMEAVMDSQQYKELRSLTRLDLINSAIGTKALSKEAKRILKDLHERAKEAMEAAKLAKQEADQAAAGQVDGEGSEDKNGEHTQGTGKEYLTLEQAIEKLRAAEKELKDKLLTPKEKRDVSRALTEVVSQTKETADLITDWGLQQSEEFTRIGYQEQLQLVERLKNNDKLKAIANLMGRYRRMVLAQKQTKIKRGSDSLYDVTQGNDLGRIIPSEALRLKHPITRMVFIKDYYEKSLLQHEYESKVKKHKGGIAIAIDESGSMSGEKEIWAKALALGLLEIARIQKRNLFIVHFNSNKKESLRVDDFLKTDPYNINKVIDCCTYFAGGGTQFMPPMDLCRDKISMEPEFSTADIIMLTDGASAVLPEWCTQFNAWKKQKNITVYSVIIDYGYHYKQTLEMFSDDVTDMSKFTKESKDRFMFKMMNNL